MDKRTYAIRYLVDGWNKPVPAKDANGEHVCDGVRISNSNYGYTDTLLVCSVIRDDVTNEIVSIFFADSDSMVGKPSRELMTAIRDEINHYLEHHCDEL